MNERWSVNKLNWVINYFEHTEKSQQIVLVFNVELSLLLNFGISATNPSGLASDSGGKKKSQIRSFPKISICFAAKSAITTFVKFSICSTKAASRSGSGIYSVLILFPNQTTMSLLFPNHKLSNFDDQFSSHIVGQNALQFINALTQDKQLTKTGQPFINCISYFVIYCNTQ